MLSQVFTAKDPVTYLSEGKTALFEGKHKMNAPDSGSDSDSARGDGGAASFKAGGYSANAPMKNNIMIPGSGPVQKSLSPSFGANKPQTFLRGVF